MFQVLHLKSNEMSWLCRHLGHTQKVHDMNYRATMDLVERVHITKIMLIQDLNLQQHFQGKKLEEIKLEGTINQYAITRQLYCALLILVCLSITRHCH